MRWIHKLKVASKTLRTEELRCQSSSGERAPMRNPKSGKRRAERYKAEQSPIHSYGLFCYIFPTLTALRFVSAFRERHPMEARGGSRKPPGFGVKCACLGMRAVALVCALFKQLEFIACMELNGQSVKVLVAVV